MFGPLSPLVQSKRAQFVYRLVSPGEEGSGQPIAHFSIRHLADANLRHALTRE